MIEQIAIGKLKITSPAFKDHGLIPVRYTCDGENISPALQIRDIPKETVSLCLIVDDPDAPVGTWDHWIVWNIPPEIKIEENSNPGIEGLNSFQYHQYGGPCPPSGTHRYSFRIYALDTLLELSMNANKAIVMKAMAGHVLAIGELTGKYKRV